jgi:hypothetical protein
MAVDTAAKRNSACASRRLPWSRRFLPFPDGTIDQADRQTVVFVYGGILAEEETPVLDVNVLTRGWRLPIRPNYDQRKWM